MLGERGKIHHYNEYLFKNSVSLLHFYVTIDYFANL